MPLTPVEKIWMDGELVAWEDAKIHVLTHALHYGTGVFEGVRAYETKRGASVFRLEDHVRRLFRSAHIYQMEVPFTPDEIARAIKDTVAANGLSACEMGLNPLLAPVNVSIAVWAWGAYLGEEGLENGVRVKISSWKRNDHNILPPAAKATGQYINSALAKVEALEGGYDEAIMLNIHGYVTDGTGENVFVVKDGALFTPPLSAGCLDGITRDSVMTIARDLGYDVTEREVVRADLYTSDEAFFTGTAAEVCPIREVDDRRVGANGRGPITKEIQQTFCAAARGEIDKYQRWLSFVTE
jgi:branched-chain amino acid aminotransferase